MKRQDVLFAELEQKLGQAGSSPGQAQLASYMAERQRMLDDYDRYVAGLYDRKLNEKEKLILRVTRLFGECDVAAPPEYIGEVMRYIAKWQSTGRFARALKRAQDAGYPPTIAAAFMAQGLPPQYFYLAMQESSFDPHAIGPPDAVGHRQGHVAVHSRNRAAVWPEARAPGVRSASVDEFDDRFNWEKATPAAARYIKDIYSTDAQASGLLVMASYNWGEDRIIDLLRQMPADPRERNFWKLLAQYRRDDAARDLRLRLLHRVGGGHRREPEAVRIPVRQSSRVYCSTNGSGERRQRAAGDSGANCTAEF